MKYFVSTGEMSGDLHLSYLVKEILKEEKTASFFGVAGQHSEEAGVAIIQDIEELAVMGFFEAVQKYKFLKGKAFEYIEFIKSNDIKKVIMVDYGGFNLKFLELLKKEVADIEVYYYIPPKLWVWGEKRIKKLRLADHIIVIFPWELEFYKKHGIDAVYFGNPFFEKYKKIEKFGDKILLLPGSREQEVKKLLPTMLELVKERRGEQFLLKLASREHLKWVYEDFGAYENLELVFDLSLEEAAKRSKMAVAASGTVVLELALFGLPGVVVYKTGRINEFLARYLLKINYVSLPNITLNQEVYPELLQKSCNKGDILDKLGFIEENRGKIMNEIDAVRTKLSGKDIVNSYAKYIIGEKHEKPF